MERLTIEIYHPPIYKYQLALVVGVVRFFWNITIRQEPCHRSRKHLVFKFVLAVTHPTLKMSICFLSCSKTTSMLILESSRSIGVFCIDWSILCLSAVAPAYRVADNLLKIKLGGHYEIDVRTVLFRSECRDRNLSWLPTVVSLPYDASAVGQSSDRGLTQSSVDQIYHEMLNIRWHSSYSRRCRGIQIPRIN